LEEQIADISWMQLNKSLSYGIRPKPRQNNVTFDVASRSCRRLKKNEVTNVGLFDRFKSDKAPTQKATAAAQVTNEIAPTQKRLTAGEWNDKGLALAKSGRNQEAIQYFDKALELDPKNVEALVNKGAALYALSRYEAALQCCYRTLARDPKNAVAQELKRAVLNKSAAKAPDTIGDSRAVEPLTRALDDADSDVRKSAVEALKKIGDRSH
jgi:tetratricopeptide (TPR) repeat protein